MVYKSEFCLSRMYLSTRKMINTDANVFINNYQVNLGRRILQLGKNPLVKNTPPIPLNVSWGAYSSQYPVFRSVIVYSSIACLKSKSRQFKFLVFAHINKLAYTKCRFPPSPIIPYMEYARFHICRSTIPVSS